MFSLINQQAKLTSFNPRAELHGDEPKPAADIRIDVNVESGELAHFSPTLRGFLFHKDSAANNDLVNAQHDAPNLRFPLMGAIKWGAEYQGYTLKIAHGIGGSDLVLQLCEVNAFVFDPKEGGTVHISMRVQCHPDEKQFGKLCQMISETIDVTLDPPQADDDEVLTEKRSKRKSNGSAARAPAH